MRLLSEAILESNAAGSIKPIKKDNHDRTHYYKYSDVVPKEWEPLSTYLRIPNIISKGIDVFGKRCGGTPREVYISFHHRDSGPVPVEPDLDSGTQWYPSIIHFKWDLPSGEILIIELGGYEKDGVIACEVMEKGKRARVISEFRWKGRPAHDLSKYKIQILEKLKEAGDIFLEKFQK